MERYTEKVRECERGGEKDRGREGEGERGRNRVCFKRREIGLAQKRWKSLIFSSFQLFAIFKSGLFFAMEAAKGLKQEKEKILTFTQTIINWLTSDQFNKTVYREI